MKTLRVTFFKVIFLALTSLNAFSQGFVNLDFEHPVLPLVPDASGTVSITNALPGWAEYIGGPYDRVHYDTITLGGAGVSLHDTNTYIPILQGTYTVYLQQSFGGALKPAIAQTGQVPATARSVRFYLVGGVTLSFAGQTIPLSNLGSTHSYNIFGGDMTVFANQTGELRFQGDAYLDNIFFSDQPIPEPGSVSVVGLGLILLYLRGHRGRPV